MRTTILPDGTVLDITVSDLHTGPGKEGGQRVGSGQWYRINGGEWILSNHRTMHRMFEWVELSENVKEFLEGEEWN